MALAFVADGSAVELIRMAVYVDGALADGDVAGVVEASAAFGIGDAGAERSASAGEGAAVDDEVLGQRGGDDVADLRCGRADG